MEGDHLPGVTSCPGLLHGKSAHVHAFPQIPVMEHGLPGGSIEKTTYTSVSPIFLIVLE